jgi:mannosyltransferase
MIHKLTGLLARRKNEEKLFRMILIAAAFMAGFISLWIGLKQSIWFDEAYSILLAQQPIAELLRLTALDTHPPLYYLLLKGWASIFGWSELSLRISSVLPMMGAVVVGGLLVRRMFGNRAAVGAVLTLMLAPLLLRYGFEIRMYAWASFIGISATYALYSAWKAKNRKRLYWLIGYALLVAAGTYLLYYLVFLWFAHVAWLVYVHVKHRKPWKTLLPYVLSYVGAVVLFLPWLSSFLAQTANDALAPIGQPLNLEQLLGIATFNTMYHPIYAVGMGLTAVAIALVAMLIWAIPRARVALKGKSDEIALLIMYTGVPIVLLMGISLNRSMYTERYLSHVAIGLLLLLGVVIVSAVQKAGREKRRAIWALAILYGALFVGTLHLASIGNFNFQRMQTPTVREAASSLQNCAPGTKLLAADPYVATEFSYYLPQCDLYFVSEWDTLGGGYAPFSGSEYR